MPPKRLSELPPEEVERALPALAVGRLVDSVAGFNLPEDLDNTLLSVQRTINAASSPAWRAEEWGEWRDRFLNAVGHVRDGLTATHYHFGRAREVEQNLNGIARTELPERLMPPLGGTVFSQSPVLGFEYQAFLFARRRTLDYLASVVAWFFGHQSRRESHRIKRLPKTIDGALPAEARDAVCRRFEEAKDDLGLSDQARQAPRDLVAHFKPLEGGHFNLTRHPHSGEMIVILAGGGEGLPGWVQTDASGLEQGPTLEQVLSSQLAATEHLILGVYKDLALLDSERVPNRVPN